jgi:molybdopterin synthase sulfur carrier subunit
MIIKLFGGLRQIAGGAEMNESGTTIREVLQKISAKNDTLGAALFSEGGTELRPHVRVMVNGVDSELVEGLDTAVGEEDQIAIFPPLAGG